ncbi:regulation of otic vesicle morphogenesis [Dermatophagoides farinae]|uniref:Regulation of otic vesicle morphogenesis n=1 Tax=Dermatophagoides farinae TaxID=6954 RepID=A0A922L0F0_DERFA|nr:regulation of otic vesicle morphogenesis [Dermatophagoides farinae]
MNSMIIKQRNLKLISQDCLAIGLMIKKCSHNNNNNNSSSSPISAISTSPTSLNRRQSSNSPLSIVDKQQQQECQKPMELFNEFIRINSKNNHHSSTIVTNCFQRLSMAGFLYPSTLLIIGQTSETLETLCSLWSKRILKSPAGYIINFVGYTTILEANTICQSHFTPLAEALYRCIDELGTTTNGHLAATYDQILKRLCSEFPSVELPADDIIRSTLLAMTAENKLNYDSYHQTYTVSSNFVLPWGIMDEFESLSLSDRTPTSKHTYHTEDGDGDDDDDVDDVAATVGYDDFSDCIATNKKLQLLQRRNSSSNDNNMNNNSNSGNHYSKTKQPFRRSKSFKLNYKTTTTTMITNQDNNGDDDMNDKERTKFVCSPTDLMLKRQSLLGKLFKLNSKGRPSQPPQSSSSRLQSSSTSPSSSMTIPLHSEQVKCNDFGSQFPEENFLNDDHHHLMINTNDDNGIIFYDDNHHHQYQQQQHQHQYNHYDHHGQQNNKTTTAKRKQFSTQSTQTVKSGPEEIITVVMRQSGRHALSRAKRLSKDRLHHPQQQQQQVQQQMDHHQGVCYSKNRCLSSSLPPTRNHHVNGKCSSCCHCCYCTGNQMESRLTRDKKSRHISKHHYHHHQNSSMNECHRCCHSNVNTGDCKGHNNHNHRKQSHRSTSSIRHHHHKNHHRNSLIDYYIDDDGQNNIDNGSFCHTPSSAEHVQTVYPGIIMANNKSGQHDIIDHRLNNNNGNLILTNRILYLNDGNNDDKCLDLFNLDNDDDDDNHNHDHWTAKHPIQINDHNSDVDDESTTGVSSNKLATSSQDTTSSLMTVNSNDNNRISRYDNHQYQNQHSSPVSTNGNIFVNNSVSVKIEIETSSSMTATAENSGHRQINCHQITDDSYRQSSMMGHRQQQQQQQLVAGAIFTNGTYSQFDFDHAPKHSSQNINPNPVNVQIFHNNNISNNNNNNNNNRLLYPPELNYANSVTALKEQIARAKANFFKESLPQPSTTT